MRCVPVSQTLRSFCAAALLVAACSWCPAQEQREATRNPEIDDAGFKVVVEKALAERKQRLLTEAEFTQVMKESGVVVLDARSSDKFALLHVDGAKNLPLPDFTAEQLAKIIPAKSSKVLIYCNNNFRGSPSAMPGKSFTAALNLHTYTTLASYGYANVYELGPNLDVRKTSIPFVGKEVEAREKAAK